MLAGESLINREEESVSLTGERKTLLTTKIPFRDRQGNICGLVGLGRDITERKQAEVRLAEAQADLVKTSRQAGMAEVATGILHNVGNVLNSVNVSATMVAERIKKSKSVNLPKLVAMLREHETDLAAFLTLDARGKQVPAYLAQLTEHLGVEQGELLKELAGLQNNLGHIKDVVSMQQCYSKVSGTVEKVQVRDLIEDTLRMNASSFVRHDLTVVREFAEVPPIEVDKSRLLQILVNLVRNAKHACDDQGHDHKQLTLRIASANNRVQISVADNGVGIPPENLTRIFTHGFTTKKDGHGFGLHSGVQAIKDMGGELRVHSDGPGCGATFTIELPLQPPKVSQN